MRHAVATCDEIFYSLFKKCSFLAGSDVNKAISFKAKALILRPRTISLSQAKAKHGPFQGQAKAECLQEQDKPPPV